MMTYDVINLESTYQNGGYEVNDAHFTGQQVELEEPTLEHAVKALKAARFFYKSMQTRWLRIYEEDNGGSLTICQKSNGRFLYELRPKSGVK